MLADTVEGMGDRTFYRLQLPDTITDAALVAAAEAFTSEGITFYGENSSREWIEELRRQPAGSEVLTVDIEERYCGETQEAADAVLQAIQDAGEDVAFTVTEDPKNNWLGMICRHEPGQEMFVGDCDAEGRAVVADGEVEAMLQAEPDPAEALKLVCVALGIDWPRGAVPAAASPDGHAPGARSRS